MGKGRTPEWEHFSDTGDDELYELLEQIRRILDHPTKHTPEQKRTLVDAFNTHMNMRDPSGHEIRFSLKESGEIIALHGHR